MNFNDNEDSVPRLKLTPCAEEPVVRGDVLHTSLYAAKRKRCDHFFDVAAKNRFSADRPDVTR